MPAYPVPQNEAARNEAVRRCAILDTSPEIALDEVVTRHGLEKITTIGDAYMAVARVPEPARQHTVDACLAALEMVDLVARFRTQREKLRLPALDIRIGLHAGPVMAGAAGRRKFTYDIWGDAVNVAARLEATSEPNRINVSEKMLGRVRSLAEATPRGSVEMRNKAPVPMFFLDRLKPEFPADAAGRHPNERLGAERERLATGFAGWGQTSPGPGPRT